MKVALTAAFFAMISFASTAASDDAKDDLTQALAALTGAQVPAESLIETSAKGVFEWINDSEVYYVTMVDGHLIVGEVYNMERQTTLREQKSQVALNKVVNDIPVEELVVFSAHGDHKRTITVFTDIDCGYCRRLHAEVPQLNEAGVEVRYAAYPRAGVGSSSYEKIVTVWCSGDQQTAMTRAKKGEHLQPVTCDNPVAEQFESGSRAGISGTPTLVVDDGSVIGGYVPAEQLLVRLGITLN